LRADSAGATIRGVSRVPRGGLAASISIAAAAAAAAAAVVVVGCALPALGPAGDANVRGGFPGGFMWAQGEPTQPIGTVDPAEVREAVDRAAMVIESDRDFDFPISIIATFDRPDQAEAHAQKIREILMTAAAWYADPANPDARAALDDPDRMAPLTPPEETAMRDNLLAPGDRGIGWGGDPETADDAVYTLGPIVVVTGLESDSFTTEALPELHPLAHLLAAQGADVLLEGDRFGEGSIIADVSCETPDGATATKLLDEVGDAIATAQYNTRPPWLGAPTGQQALARATYRRWLAGYMDAASDDRTHELLQQIASASTAEARDAATRELSAHLGEKGLQNIEGEVDLEALRLLVEQPDVTDADAYEAWAGDIAERLGRLPVQPTEYGDRPSWDDANRLVHTGSVRVNGGRLEIGWAAPSRFAAAMPYLAGYLEERGCSDIRLATVDFDSVRGD
jgi:hypothetical protein